jgi:hypothetical protein
VDAVRAGLLNGFFFLDKNCIIIIEIAKFDIIITSFGVNLQDFQDKSMIIIEKSWQYTI